MEKKVKLDDLYFGVKLFPLSFDSQEGSKNLTTYNLFDFGRVKWSVARWATMNEKERKEIFSDALKFCFGDVWSRCEYEFVVSPWGGLGENDKVVDVGTKVDTYQMYVEPNADLLMKMVNSVSVNSAKKYLAEERKRRKGLL